MLGSLTPVLDRLRPLASDSCKCHKHKFFEGCVVRKDPLVLGDLTQLAVVALHGVGGVYYAPYVFGVLEVRAEPFPVVTPALDDYRIVLAPLQFLPYYNRGIIFLSGWTFLCIGRCASRRNPRRNGRILPQRGCFFRAVPSVRKRISKRSGAQTGGIFALLRKKAY